jgi:hypothetical protein
LWIMDASGDALFPRRYLEEFEKRVSELHGCVERARERAAEAMRQDVRLLLDAAGAHEQAATAYELAGGNGHARDFQARAMRHRRVAAARRAAAASLASGVPMRRDSDDPRPQAAIPDGNPPGLPDEPGADADHLGVSCGNCHQQQRDTKFYELPRDITYRAVGPWQAVLLLAVLLRRPTGRRATKWVITTMASGGRQGTPIADGAGRVSWVKAMADRIASWLRTNGPDQAPLPAWTCPRRAQWPGLHSP